MENKEYNPLRTLGYLVLAVIMFFAIKTVVIELSKATTGSSSSATSQTLTKEKYMDKVAINCPKGGSFTLEECLCFYNAMIDTYGIDETLKFDKAALSGETDFSKYEDTFAKCFNY